MEIICERLIQLRNNMGLSQDDLAEYLNMSQPYVSSIEKGTRKLNLRVLNKLCALYGCSNDYILGKDDSYTPIEFAFRSNNIGVKDLDCVASINKLLANMRYMDNVKNKAD